jgi:hypothetical protein
LIATDIRSSITMPRNYNIFGKSLIEVNESGHSRASGVIL